MLIFYLNRSAWHAFVWWKPVGIVIAFVLLLTIYKQRAAIASVIFAVVIGSVLSLKRWRIVAFTILGLLVRRRYGGIHGVAADDGTEDRSGRLACCARGQCSDGLELHHDRARRDGFSVWAGQPAWVM